MKVFFIKEDQNWWRIKQYVYDDILHCCRDYNTLLSKEIIIILNNFLKTFDSYKRATDATVWDNGRKEMFIFKFDDIADEAFFQLLTSEGTEI